MLVKTRQCGRERARSLNGPQLPTGVKATRSLKRRGVAPTHEVPVAAQSAGPDPQCAPPAHRQHLLRIRKNPIEVSL